MLREALSGRALAKIDESGAAIGQAHQHESAAADVARGGMRHGQREAHRHGRVHRVAARFEHRDSGIGGVRLHRDHHGVPRMHRLRRPHRAKPRASHNTHTSLRIDT